MWLDLFCKEVGEVIVIRKADLCSIEKELINDWSFLKDMMARSLEDIIKDKKEDMKILREKPTTILCQQLQGCWAQCPFCKAICTNTIPNHDGDHSVRFHRSKALSGYHWHDRDNFDIDFCTTSVISDASFKKKEMDKFIPYQMYRTAGDPYNTWSITGDGNSQQSFASFVHSWRRNMAISSLAKEKSRLNGKDTRKTRLWKSYNCLDYKTQWSKKKNVTIRSKCASWLIILEGESRYM